MFYLHFKCYPLSYFFLQKPPIPSHPPHAHQPNHFYFWPWKSPILGYITFTGPRASIPIDDKLGYLLLYMQLEPWVPSCVFFDWWFRPRELCGYWLVHIVLSPMGLQTLSGPWELFLAPSLGTLCFVYWMAVSIHFCICQELAEPFRRQLYQAPVSKLLLESTIVSGLDGCLWVGSPGGAVSGWSFLQSLLQTLSL